MAPKSIKQMTEEIIQFRDERDWKQFHNPKDFAISLSLEAAEVLEHFQWKTADELEIYVKENKEDISDELADVLYWVISMAEMLDINLSDAFSKKMKKNEAKYPVEKAKGKKLKYNKL